MPHKGLHGRSQGAPLYKEGEGKASRGGGLDCVAETKWKKWHGEEGEVERKKKGALCDRELWRGGYGHVQGDGCQQGGKKRGGGEEKSSQDGAQEG